MSGYELMDVDVFVNEQLDALERQAQLEQIGRLGADVEYELIEGGPLKVYLQSIREDAALALKKLAVVDPNDKVKITELQGTVLAYLRAAQWCVARIEDANAAQEQIEREYGSNDEASYFDEE